MNETVKINQAYKIQKKLQKLERDSKKKLLKQQLAMKKKKEQDIQKAKDDIILNYQKKLISMQKYHQSRLEKQKRKIEWKKLLKKHTKKKSYAKHFNELLTLIQKFARLRDSNKLWYWNCITCWKEVFWKDANGWHAITRMQKRSAVLEECINLQCSYCNWELHWNYWEYRYALDNKYWAWTYERLKAMKWPSELTIDDICKLKIEYKEKIQQLLWTKIEQCK